MSVCMDLGESDTGLHMDRGPCSGIQKTKCSGLWGLELKEARVEGGSS